MAEKENSTPTRLDDFILLGREGKAVEAEVFLRKIPIVQKAHPDETDDAMSEIDAYLLSADFTLRAEGGTGTVSKVYVVGYEDESVATARVNRNIANDRLKMDYRRLEEAKVKFKEKFFE